MAAETKYAEVIFEPGSKSIVAFDSIEELNGFLSEHHRRALSGEPGAPQNQVERSDLGPADFAIMPSVDRMRERPAERITKVYIYDEHPADLHPTGIQAATLQTLIEGMTKPDGTVDAEQVVGAMRDETSPVYPMDQGRHESIYKAQASGEHDLSFLNDVNNSGNADTGGNSEGGAV